MLLKRILRAGLRLILKVRNFRSGQIKKHHEVGKWIEFLASLSGVNTIVEIGTWNGAGSSMAIARGVVSRPKKDRDHVKVVGYEINPIMAKTARRRLARFGFFDVVYGSLVSIDDLDRSNLTQTEEQWLKQDESWILGAPNVINSLPENLDLLILDGGEFSTLAEFNLLKERVSDWIILDDTNTRKCAEILKIIKYGNEVLTIYESKERNGTAILKRVK
jgi:hypothetical protein